MELKICYATLGQNELQRFAILVVRLPFRCDASEGARGVYSTNTIIGFAWLLLLTPISASSSISLYLVVLDPSLNPARFPLGRAHIRENTCPTCRLPPSIPYVVGVELTSPAGRNFAAISEMVLSSNPPP